MKIVFENVGRRYHYDWIFRKISFVFESGKTYAITGRNGSGKSTLLQVAAGLLSPSEGKVIHENPTPTDQDQWYQHLVWCAPGLDLVEDFTAQEALNWHFSIKPMIAGTTVEGILKEVGLWESRDKYLHQLSSGMRQRIKLATVLFADVPVWLLDEPCTNLDAAGIAWYRTACPQNSKNRLVLIASNDPQEYDFASQIFDVTPHK